MTPARICTWCDRLDDEARGMRCPCHTYTPPAPADPRGRDWKPTPDRRTT